MNEQELHDGLSRTHGIQQGSAPIEQNGMSIGDPILPRSSDIAKKAQDFATLAGNLEDQIRVLTGQRDQALANVAMQAQRISEFQAKIAILETEVEGANARAEEARVYAARLRAFIEGANTLFGNALATNFKPPEQSGAKTGQ